jgi:hypothetical protein
MKVTELQYKVEDGKLVFTAKKAIEKPFNKIEGVRESFEKLNNRRLAIRKRKAVPPHLLSTLLSKHFK